MMEMERRIHTGNFTKNMDANSKKILLENFSAIKEIDMQNIEKQGRLDFFGQELNRIQVQNDELISEKDNLLRELEQAKDDNIEYYNNKLKNPQMASSSGMDNHNKFTKTTKNQLEEEFQQAIDEMNNKNNNLMEVIRNLESENNQLKSYLNDYKDNNQKLSQDNDNLAELSSRYKKEYEDIARAKTDIAFKMKKNNEQVT